jgi:peptidoglycan/xylan/chitin deacetylase (PgdA/CDA1 family)
MLNPYGRGRASGAFEALRKVSADYAGVTAQLDANATILNRQEILSRRERKAIDVIIDDDARNSFWTRWQQFIAAGVKVCCAVIGDKIGATGYHTAAELQYAMSQGVELLLQAGSHVDLTTLTEQELTDNLQSGLDALEAIGVGLSRFILVYPFGQNNALVRKVARRLGFRCAITTNLAYPTVAYNTPPVNTYALWRNMLSTTTDSPTLEWLNGAIDTFKVNNALGIWMSHSYEPGWDADIVSGMLSYADAQGVENLYMSEALDMYANLLDAGDDTYGARIGCDGRANGRAFGVEPVINKYDFFTPIDAFPDNSVTHHYVNGATGVGLPNDGVITRFKMPGGYGAHKEEYRPFQFDRLYMRTPTSDGIPQDFRLTTPMSFTTANRPKSTVDGYTGRDTTLNKAVQVQTIGVTGWQKLVLTATPTVSGNITVANKVVAVTAGMTIQQVMDAIVTAGHASYTIVYPSRIGKTDTNALYYRRTVPIDMAEAATLVDTDSTGTAGTFTVLRNGVTPVWVDMLGTVV